MAIRTLTFSLNERGIDPASVQFAGLQGEHSATGLRFLLEEVFYQFLLTKVGQGQSLVYRIDAFDSTGAVFRTASQLLSAAEVTFPIEENLTRNGGQAKVFLILSLLDETQHTEMELYSFPALLQFESTPQPIGETGQSRESLSSLENSAKEAAKTAQSQAQAASATAAEIQQLKAQIELLKQQTVAARMALEQGAEFFLDGGNAASNYQIQLAVDDALSSISENPVQNKVIAAALAEKVDLANAFLCSHPVGSVYYCTGDIDPQSTYGGTWQLLSDENDAVSAWERTA
ncbi:MAG: hypothetical protein IKI29_01975 [Clostridia bacterium]|nr:hypothetical protein [Clostridia bacterium]